MTLAGTITNAAKYVAGQCTAFVASVLSWVPGGWGNAGDWFRNAQTQGYATGSQPQAGAIAVWGANAAAGMPLGHVAEVTQVNPDGSYVVQEQNFSGGPFVVDTRDVPAGGGGDLLGFIYGPPGTAAPATLAASTSTSSGSNPVADAIGAAMNSVVDSWVTSGLQAASQGAANAGTDVRAWVNNNLIALAVAGAVTAVVMWRVEADRAAA